MQVIETIDGLRQWRALAPGASLGLVPTMGYLHQGHLALVKRAKAENERVVVSIFVNPTQFGPGEDLDQYPRDLTRDLALLEPLGVDAVFCPSVEEMYPSGPVSTQVQVTGPMTAVLCGASRPTHFAGVTTVVTMLFHIVGPDRAYFGQKDYQQVAVIRRMVNDLHFPLEIVACPIVREADGLAMSSRNTFLTPDQRRQALALSKSLAAADAQVAAGETRAAVIEDKIRARLEKEVDLTVDYIAMVDPDELTPVETIDGPILVALAAWVGTPRLIDNRLIDPSKKRGEQ